MFTFVTGRKLPLKASMFFLYKMAAGSMFLPSGNDAALAVAQNYPGGETVFIQTMNKKAEKLFKEYIDDIFNNRQGLEHPTALFYYGISKYEQERWQDAILEFDRALKIYPNFSDVKFYKAMCLVRLEKMDEANILLEEGKKDIESGFTINEDNTTYETYPYQKRWAN